MTTVLYYGDNGVHEFWESADSKYLIIRNHHEQWWHSLQVKGDFELFGRAKRPQTVANRIQRKYGASLELSREQRWTRKRKNAKRMTLVNVNSVKSFNRLSEPCADCGVKPNREHLINCKGGCHSLEATTTQLRGV